MDQPPQISFDVGEEDYIALMQRSMRRLPLLEQQYRKNWRTWTIAGLLGASVVAAASYSIAHDPDRKASAAAVTAGGFAIVWCVYAWRSMTRRAFQRRLDATAAKAVRQGPYSAAYGPMRVEVLPQGLQTHSSGTTTVWAWDRIGAIDPTEEGVYIDMVDGGCVRVPRRAFASDDSRRSFIRAIDTARGAA